MTLKRKNVDWLKKGRAERVVQLTNIRDKIPNYITDLPFPEEKADRLILCCNQSIMLSNYIIQARATMEQLTDYETLLDDAKGGTQGDPAPSFGGVKVLTLPTGAFVGAINELRELVDDIKHCDNYTHDIGEDLMIVPPAGEDRDPDSIIAEIKPKTTVGSFKVKIEGSLQGANAMRVKYLMKGGTIPQSFFLTKLPAEITIAPTVAGQPESGHLSAILIEDNEEIGQSSPDYPVTVG